MDYIMDLLFAIIKEINILIYSIDISCIQKLFVLSVHLTTKGRLFIQQYL